MKLTLRVNGRFDTVIHRDEPMLVGIRLSCPDLVEAVRDNAIIDMDLEELEEAFKSGEVKPDEYAQQRKALEDEKTEIESETIGSAASPWHNELEISVTTVGDEQRSQTWPLKVRRNDPDEPTIETSPTLDAFIEYAFTPAEVQLIPEGGYTLKAKLGEDESNEAIADIKHGENSDPSDESVLIAARYHIDEKDYNAAERVVGRLAKKDAKNVTCLMLRGDIHVARGDAKSALRSYNKALEEWMRKNPDAEEPPRVIESRIARLNLKK